MPFTLHVRVYWQVTVRPQSSEDPVSSQALRSILEARALVFCHHPPRAILSMHLQMALVEAMGSLHCSSKDYRTQ